MMKNILITGGAGFIGSHTCLILLSKGYQLFVIDSFQNSSPKSLQRLLEINKLRKKEFKQKLHVFKGDLTDKIFLEKVFSNFKNSNHEIHGVIHFAGLKSVSDSFKEPLIYWKSNVFGTINLLEMIKKYNCKNFVFSSSATIYAENKNLLLSESSEINPVNPYGNTKATIEKLLEDVFLSYDKEFKFASLRYFNPIGAHDSGLIGEDPKGKPRNIFPLIINTALGLQKELEIYGNDYPSHDGTAIRDYIHVMDVAEVHINVLEHLLASDPINITFNIGTGIGTSVLDLVKTFERVNNIKVPYVFANRRVGDNFYVVADNSLLKSKLNIFPKKSIDQMCRDGWKWRKLNPNGF